MKIYVIKRVLGMFELMDDWPVECGILQFLRTKFMSVCANMKVHWILFDKKSNF